jgi:hypothetical protein
MLTRLSSFQLAEVFVASFVYSFVYHPQILLIATENRQLSFLTSTSSRFAKSSGHFHFPT